MTAPKDGDRRRIIVDLSLPSPQQCSVNLSVSKFSYVGTQLQLKLPTIDNICQVLNTVGKNTKIFKVDLARAFRQLYVDPFDIKYLGLCWRGQFYVDVCVPFGNRNGTLACVRVTDAIRFVLAKKGIFVFNYIDDLISLAPDSVFDSHFQLTINLLNNLGFHISDSKTVAPTYVATCLYIDITFNISMGYITIPNQKLLETISLCKFYFFKKLITKNQLQVLIGHLIFLHKAVKPARVFVNRTLDLLRKIGDATKVAIDEGTKRDLQWFMACAHAVNGNVEIYKSVLPRIDIFVDASLTGLGGSSVIMFMS
jgi:hypothetical protein